jgi:hypothetical protein
MDAAGHTAAFFLAMDVQISRVLDDVRWISNG